MKTTISILSIFFAVFAFVFFLTRSASAQWVPVTDLAGVNAQCFGAIGSASSQILFAGSDRDGVFRSKDNGKTWTQVNTGLDNTDIQALAESGTNLFAGTGSGVYISTNNGVKWAKTSPFAYSHFTNRAIRNFGYYFPVTSIIAKGSNIFAGTQSEGVYLSSDAGKTWAAVNGGLKSTQVVALTMFGAAPSSTMIFAATGVGVFSSTDNGTSWTEADSGLKSAYVQSFAVNGSNIFAGSARNGFFISTDKGASWTSINTGLPDSALDYISSLAASGENVFAGIYLGSVYRTIDNGAIWVQVGTGLKSYAVQTLAACGTNLYATTVTWSFSSSPGRYDVYSRPLSDFPTLGKPKPMPISSSTTEKTSRIEQR